MSKDRNLSALDELSDIIDMHRVKISQWEEDVQHQIKIFATIADKASENNHEISSYVPSSPVNNDIAGSPANTISLSMMVGRTPSTKANIHTSPLDVVLAGTCYI